MTEQTVAEEFKRDWVRGKMFITFTYDYLRDSIPANKIEFQVVNVRGENMNRVFRSAGHVTGPEATAIRSAMKREMEEQVLLIADEYTLFPELGYKFPAPEEEISGLVNVQIRCLSHDPGGMTVEWKLDDGVWQPTVYDAGSGYYETTGVDTNLVADGTHNFTIRAQDVDGKILLELEPFNISVDNS